MDYKKKVVKKMFKLLEKQEFKKREYIELWKKSVSDIRGLQNHRDALIRRNNELEEALGNIKGNGKEKTE